MIQLRLLEYENEENEITILHGHDDRVSSVTFDKNEMMLVSGSYDGKIKIWSL